MQHLSYIKQESKLPLNRINRKVENGKEPHVEAIRSKTLEDGKTVCRLFVKAEDTGVLGGVGWVINDDIKQCMLCSHSFSFITRRHHCRACGLLVCYLCSGNQSLIAGAEKLGQQRICNDCCSKEAAKIAVPINVYPSLDWGRPLAFGEEKVENSTVTSDRDPETDDTVDGSVAIGPTEIHSVDVRTISATQASHEAMKAAQTPKKTPAKAAPTPAAAKTPAKEQQDLNDRLIPPTPSSTASNNTSNGSMSDAPTPETKVQLVGLDGQKIFITHSMMVFEQDLLLPRLQVRELKNHAVDHPKMLLGWQITTDVDVKPESIYIVTDIRKNSAYKTEFKLVQMTADLKVKETWTLLKRSATKVGIDFVPMRKVLYVGEQDLTKNIDLTLKKRRSSLRL